MSVHRLDRSDEKIGHAHGNQLFSHANDAPLVGGMITPWIACEMDKK